MPESVETRAIVLARTRERLERAGIESFAQEAAWIVTDALSIDRAELVGWPDRLVPSDAADRIETWTDRRVAREPLQYITGHAEFRGVRFEVNPAVLIPRPETEELVERLLRRIPSDRPVAVLDCGTGSGCIATSVALERPLAHVTAFDVSEPAVELARANAKRLGASVDFVVADMEADDLGRFVGGPFDVIVSNPPYIADDEASGLAEEVVGHEPHLALFTGPDPMRFYRGLAALATGRLARPRCMLAVEIHADRGARVRRVFEEAGLERIDLAADASGRERICTGFRSSDV